MDTAMKKIVLLLTFLLLAGCSPKFPAMTNLHLNVSAQQAGVYSAGATAAIHGKDMRASRDVVAYRIGDQDEIRLPNQYAPHLLLTDMLTIGLQNQGLLPTEDSSVRIELAVEELHALVTRPKILYVTEAKSRVLLHISNNNKTLSRNFDRQNSKDSINKPKVSELEEMLNEQLSDIMSTVLADEHIRKAILGQ